MLPLIFKVCQLQEGSAPGSGWGLCPQTTFIGRTRYVLDPKLLNQTTPMTNGVTCTVLAQPIQTYYLCLQ